MYFVSFGDSALRGKREHPSNQTAGPQRYGYNRLRMNGFRLLGWGIWQSVYGTSTRKLYVATSRAVIFAENELARENTTPDALTDKEIYGKCLKLCMLLLMPLGWRLWNWNR